MNLRLIGSRKRIRGVTVMCGRETGNDPAFAKAAHDLGQTLAEDEDGIIGYFGGGQFGLMGQFATGMIGHNGKVVGILPHFLKEVEKPLDCIEVIWVDDFPQRLAHFRDSGKVDAIVSLPGGVGTDAEHMEFATRDKHDQLGLPNILVNVEGFFDYRILDLRRRAEKGFLWEKPANRLFVADSVHDVLPMIRSFYANEPVQNIFGVSLRLAAAA
ncbi:MAG: LOG family protein [Patescibacteria group bacterium]